MLVTVSYGGGLLRTTVTAFADQDGHSRECVAKYCVDADFS